MNVLPIVFTHFSFVLGGAFFVFSLPGAEIWS